MADEPAGQERLRSDRQRAWLRTFAENDCATLPFYRGLALAIAADDDTPTVLDLMDAAPPGQWRPILLLAALHDVALRHPDDAFARHYPNIDGSFDSAAPDEHAIVSDLRAFVDRHRDALIELVATRATQTNEVNRSCLWFAAARLAAADLPDRSIAVVEIGPSAGLNLRFDAYSYTFTLPSDSRLHTYRADGAWTTGAAVSLECDLRSGVPPLDAELPPIVERVGIDLHRVDLADDADRRWLKACIWPEETQRHRRFDAAIAAALADPNPPRIVIDDAVDGIGDVLDQLPADAHVVVISSWVMAYVQRGRRAAFESVLDLVSTDRDITWISAESDGALDWVPRSPVQPEPHTVVGMARWRDGRRVDTLVARCHPHLAWMEWLA